MVMFNYMEAGKCCLAVDPKGRRKNEFGELEIVTSYYLCDTAVSLKSDSRFFLNLFVLASVICTSMHEVFS